MLARWPRALVSCRRASSMPWLGRLRMCGPASRVAGATPSARRYHSGTTPLPKRYAPRWNRTVCGLRPPQRRSNFSPPESASVRCSSAWIPPGRWSRSPAGFGLCEFSPSFPVTTPSREQTSANKFPRPTRLSRFAPLVNWSARELLPRPGTGAVCTRRLIESGEPIPPLPRNLSLDDVVRLTARAAADAGDFAEPCDEDFPAFGKAYRDLSPEEFAYATSIARERHKALNWICGHAPTNQWHLTPTDT